MFSMPAATVTDCKKRIFWGVEAECFVSMAPYLQERKHKVTILLPSYFLMLAEGKPALSCK